MSMLSIPDVTLLGRLTRHPDLHYTPQGLGQVTFGLEVTGLGRANPDASVSLELAHLDVRLSGPAAEGCFAQLHRDYFVVVTGSLTVHQWQDSDGDLQRITECTASRVTRLTADLYWMNPR